MLRLIAGGIVYINQVIPLLPPPPHVTYFYCDVIYKTAHL